MKRSSSVRSVSFAMQKPLLPSSGRTLMALGKRVSSSSHLSWGTPCGRLTLVKVGELRELAELQGRQLREFQARLGHRRPFAVRQRSMSVASSR